MFHIVVMDIYFLFGLFIIVGSCEVYGGVSYSTPYTGGPSHQAPTLPQLPNQFQTIIEATFVDQSYSMTLHEYVDRSRNKEALNYRRNGTQYYTLLDYTNIQTVHVQGTDCKVDNVIDDGVFWNLGNGGTLDLLNTVHAFHLLTSSGQHYLGRTQVRGITVDHWQACLSWPDGQTNFTLDYYFTVQNWVDAVTRHQIPVRAHVKGMRPVGDQGNLVDIERYYDYVDFIPTISDPEVFETQPGVVCLGRPTKPVPAIPEYFHVQLETTIVGDSGVYVKEYWYDKTKKIVRTDQRLVNPFAGIQADTPVSIIDDYKYGLKYVQDKTTGECHVMKISDPDPLSPRVEYNKAAQSTNNLWLEIVMADPAEFLDVGGNFTYSGKRVVRGLSCDVYSGYCTVNGIYLSYQYFVLAEGIDMFPSDDSSISHRIPVQLVISNETAGVGTLHTLTQFSTDEPHMSVFDVSACYPFNSSVVLNVRFQGYYKTGLRDGIINSAHSSLSTAMAVSPLRIQDVTLNYDNSFIYISAKLMDRSPFLKQFTFVTNYTSYSLNDKVFPSSLIPSMSDCASVCVLYTNFSCNGFDYCPTDSQNLCRLRKSRTSGDKTPGAPAVQCQHYGRSVDAPKQPEINSSTAYANLQTAVYNGQVTLQTSLPYIPTPFVFTAVESSVSFGMLYMKDRPTFTGQFSYHVEWKLPDIQQILNAHIWYDYEYKLVRYDMVDSDPVTKIHDYNSGLSYTIHKKTQQCIVSPISNSSFDVQTPQHDNVAGYVLQMKNPLEIFDVNQKFTYVGQSTVRDILCDVYESEEQIDLGSGKHDAVVQFYFMARDWKELSENSGLAVPSQPVSIQITAADSSDTIRYDISDFNEEHPDLRNFNLLPCFPGSRQRHILLEFNQTYHPALDTHLADFIRNVQIQLSVLTGVSPLRYQNPDVSYDGPNTFYMATMVEQSPSLLDFTSISKLKGIYTMDGTYSDISSDLACADICRNTTAFKCMSFDYCSITKMCQLSKLHNIDGKLLMPSADCNHYSKTVDSTSRPEPTVDKAITILQNKIAEGKFVVNVQLENGTVVNYQALYMSRNIFRYDYGKDSSETLSYFNRLKHQALHILNSPTVRFIRYFPYSVDDCADKCRTHPIFDCESFSYCADMGLCLLSDVHPAENASAFESSPICDLYSRKYSDSYIPYPGTVGIDVGSQNVTNAGSVDICAKLCSGSLNNTCRSFDYCIGTNTCYLSEKHELDMPTTQSPQSFHTTCTHYARNYLFDFTVTHNRTFIDQTPIVFLNVSLMNCSKLCAQYEGYTCGSFTYCGKTTTCNIYSTQTKYATSKILPSSTCDLYTRKFPNTEIPPSFTPQSQSSSPSGGQFSGGSMAAVAFGTFIPGIVLGAAILYFTKTKALLNRKHEHDACGLIETDA